MTNKTKTMLSVLYTIMSVLCLYEGYVFEHTLQPTLPVVPIALGALGMFSAAMAGIYFSKID